MKRRVVVTMWVDEERNGVFGENQVQAVEDALVKEDLLRPEEWVESVVRYEMVEKGERS